MEILLAAFQVAKGRSLFVRTHNLYLLNIEKHWLTTLHEKVLT